MKRQLPALACALACASAISACGDNVGTATRSGSRLKISWHRYEGGGRALADRPLWDDLRQETCAATAWTDGAAYCTPSSQTLITYYSSETCTSGGLYLESIERPAYVASYLAVGGEVRLHALSRPIATLLDTFWVLEEDGRCTGPYDGTLRSWYEAGEDVAPSELVRLRTVESTGGGRVATRATAADDGLYLPMDFEDRELHSPCYLYAETGGAAWCVPAATGTVEYRDDACTEPVLVRGGAGGRPPRAIAAGPMCEPHTFVVGAETMDAPAYTRVDGACLASTQAGSPWFSLREHPVATVPRVRLASGERMEPIAMEVDGITVLARELHDTETGEECTAVAEPNTGGVRCLPRDVALVTSVFNDASCTVPIDVGLVLAPANRLLCNGASTPRYARRSGDGRNVYELGPPRTAPTYRRVDGVCQPDTSSDYRFHELGDATPNDRWARGFGERDD